MKLEIFGMFETDRHRRSKQSCITRVCEDGAACWVSTFNSIQSRSKWKLLTLTFFTMRTQLVVMENNILK